MSNKRDNIYIYLWEEFNTIYVGRTVNPKSRHYTHKHRESEKTYQFSSEHHVEHPKMTIIENNLTIEEGVEREKYWIDYYKNNSSYNVLNKSRGGQKGRQTLHLTEEEKKQCQKEYYQKNKERICSYQKNYKQKHKEEIKEYQKKYNETHKRGYNKDYYNTKKSDKPRIRKKYYEKHKEERKKYQHEYYKKHKEEIKKYRKKYKAANKEKINKYKKKLLCKS